jgi:hypothetical protein
MVSGAKGIRTPDLLHAIRNRPIARRSHMLPDQQLHSPRIARRRPVSPLACSPLAPWPGPWGARRRALARRPRCRLDQGTASTPARGIRSARHRLAGSSAAIGRGEEAREQSVMRRFRITPCICDCGLGARPVLLALAQVCRECSSPFVPVAALGWHSLTTSMRRERGSRAQLVHKVGGRVAP